MNSVTCESWLTVPVMLQLMMKQHCEKVSVLGDHLHHFGGESAVSDDVLCQTSISTVKHMKNIRSDV
jgi:hypothetical protein